MQRRDIDWGLMSSSRSSLAIWAGLMACLVLVKVGLDVASVEGIVPGQIAKFAWPMVATVALVGGFCVWLLPRVGLPALWDSSVSTRRRLLLPGLVGLGLGVVPLVLEATVGYAEVVREALSVHTLNVRFPASLAFYSGGAIIIKAVFPLIVITLPVWLIANVILRGRGQSPVFWVVAAFTASLEALEQASLLNGHSGLMLGNGIATYAINVYEAWLFRRNGFLAPLSFRVAFYLVWHGVGSAIGL